MSVRCVWANLNPEADARGSWDQTLVEELTAGYEHVTLTFHESLSLINEGAVVVIPGQHNRWAEYAEPLRAFIEALPWSLTIITSDEEALFPIECLPHDDKHVIFGQYHARPEFDRVIPIGLPPNSYSEAPIQSLATLSGERRDLDVFFAGQNTHERREELIDTMKAMACEPGHGNISWVASTGFRAGLGRDDYLACMARTKIAPCPSGYHSLDSFRLYEAIAAGALPIVETHTPDSEEGDFWHHLFPTGCPFPIVECWDELPMIVDFYKGDGWRQGRDQVAEWWQVYRDRLAADFKSTIARLQS